MARGFFSGMVAGAVVAGLGLAGLSIAYRDVEPFGRNDAAPAPEVVSSPPVTPAASTSGGGEEGAPAIVSAPDAAPGGESPPAGPEAAPEGETPPRPAGAMRMPEAGTEGASVPAGSILEDAPPMAGAEAGPATPAGPPVAPGAAPAAEDAPEPQGRPASPDVQAEMGDGGAVPSAPETGAGPALPAGSGEAAAMPASPAGVAPGSAETVPEAPDSPQPPAPSVPAIVVPGSVPATPGEQAGRIGDMAENVITGRLPSIGAAPGTETGAETAGGEAAPLPAIRRNAAAFERDGEAPLMSVILLDVGPSRADLGDLGNLPFPITFVVDAAQEDAAEAVDFYRQAGAEVAIRLPLPEWAAPEDVETAFAVYRPLLEQAVAVMMPRDSSYQTLGDTARQVAEVLAAEGLGLITLPQGLNTGHKAALREGVAAGLIFRELDNDGQSIAVMRRFLDNAAFKARQNKGVIMFGHARPDTIRALIEWSLGNRVRTVSLAPVSVVLQDR